MNNFKKYGIAVPEILLPKNIDTETWSVVACDQYTQDREYWEQVKKNCGEKPSTLNLILPEVYLNDRDKSARIQKIKETMRSYIEGGVFAPAQKEMIYVERTTGYGRVRRGLVAALDLDSYEWKPFSTALTRATEATILERIPPRMEIRRGAPLELPHIMLLANDPGRILVEGAGEKIKARQEEPLYSGKLMQGAGSIKGWALSDEAALSGIEAALEKLYSAGTSQDSTKGTFLFAVGDGNHSLATAKSVWEEEKKRLTESGAAASEIEQSPVRHALVEIVNIYDTGLTFEPIHRVLFNADKTALIRFVQNELGGKILELDSEKELEEKVRASKASFGFVYSEDGAQKHVLLETEITDLAVSRLQPALDKFIKDSDKDGGGKSKVEIDYIHGSDEVFRLGKKDNAVALLLPPVAKESFFDTINARGPLPRKSFSMGEASEKRFYLESRRLF